MKEAISAANNIGEKYEEFKSSEQSAHCSRGKSKKKQSGGLLLINTAKKRLNVFIIFRPVAVAKLKVDRVCI